MAFPHQKLMDASGEYSLKTLNEQRFGTLADFQSFWATTTLQSLINNGIVALRADILQNIVRAARDDAAAFLANGPLHLQGLLRTFHAGAVRAMQRILQTAASLPPNLRHRRNLDTTSSNGLTALIGASAHNVSEPFVLINSHVLYENCAADDKLSSFLFMGLAALRLRNVGLALTVIGRKGRTGPPREAKQIADSLVTTVQFNNMRTPSRSWNFVVYINGRHYKSVSRRA
jgi:hypothetical protein